jgi:hypothetical protein
MVLSRNIVTTAIYLAILQATSTVYQLMLINYTVVLSDFLSLWNSTNMGSQPHHIFKEKMEYTCPQYISLDEYLRTHVRVCVLPSNTWTLGPWVRVELGEIDMCHVFLRGQRRIHEFYKMADSRPKEWKTLEVGVSRHTGRCERQVFTPTLMITECDDNESPQAVKELPTNSAPDVQQTRWMRDSNISTWQAWHSLWTINK